MKFYYENNLLIKLMQFITNFYLVWNKHYEDEILYSYQLPW